MSRRARLALRFLAAAACLAALQLAVGTSPRTATPYLSALSDLTASTALAAPGCNMKYCAKEPGRKSPTCHRSTSNYNCSAAGGVCTVTAC